MKGNEENTKGTETKLTARQERFIECYLEHGNGAAAAREAGYSAHTARQMACENLAKPYMASAIDRKRSEMSRESEERRARWIAHLEHLAAGAEKESDQLRAVEQLFKAEGWSAPEKQEVTSFSGTFLADLDLEEDAEPLQINDLH